jgi:Tfp pilus assembly protein PilZ
MSYTERDFIEDFKKFREFRSKKKKFSSLSEEEKADFKKIKDKLQEFLLRNPLIGKQRRKHLRADMSLDAQIFYGTFSEFCECSTIGSGGMFLKTNLRPPPGSIVKIKVSLPEGGEVEIKGKVLYSAGGKIVKEGVGVQFIEEEEKAEELKEILIEHFGSIITGGE